MLCPERHTKVPADPRCWSCLSLDLLALQLGQLSSTWNTSQAYSSLAEVTQNQHEFNVSGNELWWFRSHFMCNSTASEKGPSEKLTGGYWFSCLPLINFRWFPNIIGIKYMSTLNLGLVLNDRLNLELRKISVFLSDSSRFGFWCASWNDSLFHI